MIMYIVWTNSENYKQHIRLGRKNRLVLHIRHMVFMSSDLLPYSILSRLSDSNCVLNSLIVISGVLRVVGKEFHVLVVRKRKERW